MRTPTKKKVWLAALGFTLGMSWLAPSVSAKAEVEYGAVYDSWTSNFQASGSEVLMPFHFEFKAPNGRLQVTASTAFVQGHYLQKDLGFGGSAFDGNRLTDTLLGLAYSIPLGSFSSTLALKVNLPTGDKRWEQQQLPGNIPIIFESSRYRGRGFGFDGMYGIGKQFGDWNLSAVAGYLYSSSVDSVAGSQDVVDYGNYTVVGLVLGRRTASSLFRVKALDSIAQDSKIDGAPAFRVPTRTVLDLRWESGKTTRFLLDAGYSIYGKGKLVNTGVYGTELNGSFGDRFYLAPALEYGAGPKVRLTTGLLLKSIAANGYDETYPLYNGGGTVVGASQGLKWKMGNNTYTSYSLGYNHITNNQAALDSTGSLTDVTYNEVTFGTGVGYQW